MASESLFSDLLMNPTHNTKEVVGMDISFLRRLQLQYLYHEKSIVIKSGEIRFLKAFDQDSSQLEIFDSIAKPIVNSVINGFNGTIFAYGQTGSGKTYAITGSPREYNERGIIPRSIEHIFEHVDKSPYMYTIYISYLEIYNDSGYDLLNARHKPPSHMEELPRVVLLEDGKGEYHLRNLSIHSVSTLQEAMRLLFLGDTNRTIVETPMNESSSRSHCVFTIYVCNRGDNGSIRRSKLNLVDLAGSERVYKSNITGQTLTEAKYINLSLLYLEQVIMALSEAKRSHIPFRNSMMTYMLKDSLNGNSLTAMLATVSMSIKDVEETISTCKFAQRVSLVNTEPMINEEIDFQHQIEFLSKENAELRKQLLQMRDGTKQDSKPLTPQDEMNCRQQIEHFLNTANDNVALDSQDHNQIQFCFNLLKELYQKEKSEKARIIAEESTHKEMVEKYKKLIDQKDDEIFVLNELVETLSRKSSISLVPQTGKSIDDLNRLRDAQLFEDFASDPNNRQEVDYFSNAIQNEYSVAKKLSETIEECRKEIVRVRTSLENDKVKGDEKTRYQMVLSLMRLQDYYQQTLVKMQDVKRKTDHFKHGLEQAQTRLWQKFDYLMRTNPFSAKKFSSLTNTGKCYTSRTKAFPGPGLMKATSQGYMEACEFKTSCSNNQCPSIYGDFRKPVGPVDVSPTKLENNYFREDIKQKDHKPWYEPIEDFIPLDKCFLLHKPPLDQDPALGRSKVRSNSCRNDGDKQIRRSSSDTRRSSVDRLETVESNYGISNNPSLKRTSSDITSSYSLLNNFSKQSVRSSDSFERDLPLTPPFSAQSSHSNECHLSNHESEVIKIVEPSKEDTESLTSEASTNTSSKDLELTDQESDLSTYQSRQEKEQEKSTPLYSEKEDPRKYEPKPNLPNSTSLENTCLSRDISKISFCTLISEPEVSRQDIRLEKDTDSIEFLEFMKTIPLTGDPEVDSEIYEFYRGKFSN